MDFKTLFVRHRDELEDFWGRRRYGSTYEREFRIFGIPVLMTSNQPAPLAAADYAIPLYSTAEPTASPTFRVHLAVGSSESLSMPLPESLIDDIEYIGAGSWAVIMLADWGYCFLDLEGRKAVATIESALAAQPDLLTRALLNTILTNFIIASGFGMLHATALYRRDHLVLLMAPHNSGKSTTALHLAFAGYAIASDSMIYVCERDGGPQITAFPVGRVKLRPDMLDRFPELHDLLEREPVRGELKYGFDLRDHNPAMVHSESIFPRRVTLFLLSRSMNAGTSIQPATQNEIWESVMANSLFYDQEEAWLANLAQISGLIRVADSYHLFAGTEIEGIIAAVNELED